MEETELRFCRRCEERYEFRKSANPWWNGPKQLDTCQKCRTKEENKSLFKALQEQIENGFSQEE